MIYENDIILGALLDKLEDPNSDGDKSDSIVDKTLIIVSSDNGADKGYFKTIRDKKGSIYEGGHRIPLIVHWTNRIPVGVKSDALISQLDLYRTIAAITDIATDNSSGEDSLDMSKVLLGIDRLKGRDSLLISKNGYSEEYAMRVGKWKLIVLKEKPKELYNLERDLGETKNLIQLYPEIVGKLYTRYRKIRGIEDTHLIPKEVLPHITDYE